MLDSASPTNEKSLRSLRRRSLAALIVTALLAVCAVEMLHRGQLGLGLASAALGLTTALAAMIPLARALLGRSRLRVRPLGRLPFTWQGVVFTLLVLAVSGVAIYSGNNLMYLVLSAMLAAMLVSGLASRLGLAGLSLRLALPDHLFASQTTLARIAVKNLKRRLPSFAVRLDGFAGGSLRLEPVYFPILSPGEDTVASVAASFERRGRYLDEGVTLRTRFPFGFVEREVRLHLSQEVWVYPSIELTPEVRRVLDGIEQRSPSRMVGESHDLYRIRPQQGGESARFIDWKASARSGGLWVREYTRDDRLRVRLELDRRVDAATDSSQFEDVVQRCAAVLWALYEQRAEIIFSSDETLIRCAAAQDDVFVVLRYLAGVESTLDPEATPPRPPGDDDGQSVSYVFASPRRASADPAD